MRNAGLDEAHAGIKTARRNTNNLRYADDTTLMAESKEELKRLLMKVKESERAGLKLNIQKTKIMEPSPITSWQIDCPYLSYHVVLCLVSQVRNPQLNMCYSFICPLKTDCQMLSVLPVFIGNNFKICAFLFML